MISLLSLLLLTSWQKEIINEKQSAIVRTIHRTEDPTSGIDVEILDVDGEISVYLQVYSEIPDERVLLTINGEKSFPLSSHKGGQRFSFNKAAKKVLLSALKEEKTVTLSLCGYQEILERSNFDRKESSVLKKIRLY